MSPSAPRSQTTVLLIALALLLIGAFFRVLRLEALPELPNFAPIMAIALCGALILPGWMAIVVPGAALIASDVLLNFHYGVAPITSGELLRYAIYAVGIGTGLALRKRPGAPLVFAAVTANSLLFYLVTNTAAWFGNLAYPQTAAGWLQSLTVGLPGFPPTWVFFRNSLVSDLLFTAIILGAIALAKCEPRTSPATATV